jgi:hypothetical protein
MRGYGVTGGAAAIDGAGSRRAPYKHTVARLAETLRLSQDERSEFEAMAQATRCAQSGGHSGPGKNSSTHSDPFDAPFGARGRPSFDDRVPREIPTRDPARFGWDREDAPRIGDRATCVGWTVEERLLYRSGAAHRRCLHRRPDRIDHPAAARRPRRERERPRGATRRLPSAPHTR